MSAPHTHDAAELAALEQETGLHVVCYLWAGSPGALIPVLGARRLSLEGRRALAAKLNGRGLPVVGDPADLEAAPRA